MMKSLLIPLLLVGSALLNSVSLMAMDRTEGAVREGKLFWNNGDSLIGAIVSANSKQIVWKSPFFVEPLRIRHEVLSTIQYKAA